MDRRRRRGSSSRPSDRKERRVPRMPDAPAPPPRSDRALRLTAAGVALAIAALSMVLRDSINPRVQGLLGVVCFIAIVAAFSRDLRAVSWRTVAWGMAL